MSSGRRTTLLSLAGGKVEEVPGKSDPLLLSVPLDKLHCTRFNPRRNFGTDEELKEFGQKLEKEQLQPAVVVSKGAYLRLWPDEAENVGDALYVIANGERRYRASRMVGRATLEVVHREDVATSRATFLDAVQSENNDRKDLDPIERAIALETMVAELDGADKVAAYYEKSKGWVSQQRKLLKLVPELQALVSAGEMPVRVGRDIAGLPEDEQVRAWEAELAQRAAVKAAPRPAKAKDQPAPPRAAVSPSTGRTTPGPETAAKASRFTAVNREGQPGQETEPRPTADAMEPERFTAVNRERPHAPPETASQPSTAAPADTSTSTEPDVLPEQRTPATALPGPTPEEQRTPRTLPYDDGPFIAQHLIRKMDQVQLDKVTDLLVEHRRQRQTSNA